MSKSEAHQQKPEGAPAAAATTRHVDISEDAFLERFVPIPNPFDATASFDFGDGGCLFAPSARELEFVRAQPAEKVWTIVEGDDGIEITNGMHFVNRLGYLVSEHPCPQGLFISVDLDT